MKIMRAEFWSQRSLAITNTVPFLDRLSLFFYMWHLCVGDAFRTVSNLKLFVVNTRDDLRMYFILTSVL